MNIFKPFTGISGITFGMHKKAVRAKLNSSYRCFPKSEFEDSPPDHYEDLGFSVQYNASDICEGIEFFNTSNLYYNGINLLELNYPAIRKLFDDVSENKDEDEYGVIYHDLGFSVGNSTQRGLVTSELNDTPDNISTILIFSKDYWKDLT